MPTVNPIIAFELAAIICSFLFSLDEKTYKAAIYHFIGQIIIANTIGVLFLCLYAAIKFPWRKL